MKEGGNTRFFHNLANVRKASNHISSLSFDGSLTDDPSLIESALVNFYESLYTKDSKREAWFESWHQQSSLLEKEFTLEEIKKATLNLPKEKSPSPDGLPLLFFQDCWDTIKNDLLCFFTEFHSSGKSLGVKCYNSHFYPMKTGASAILDFQPISLISAPSKYWLRFFPTVFDLYYTIPSMGLVRFC